MNIYETLQLMPYVCILGLVILGIIEEYAFDRGIDLQFGKGRRKSRPAEGYLYTSIDRMGNTYQFRISGSRYSGFKAYLECTPVISDSEGLNVDSMGRQFLSAGACTKQEAEDVAEDFVRRQ